MIIMSIDEYRYDPDFKIDLESFAQPLLQPLREKHALVGQKLSLAISQLQSASSIEEYQQVGILVRDAWIEFAQKLFNMDSLSEHVAIPTLKQMLVQTMAHWPSKPENLIKLSKTLIDLANEVQHKTTVDALSTRWCVLATLVAMTIMLDLDSQHERLADRRYYKCPKCGSLDLSCEKGQEIDPLDGPLYNYEAWSCNKCDWEHFIMLW